MTSLDTLKSTPQRWRHPLEWWFFGLAAFVTTVSFAAALAASVFKAETLQAVRHFYVSEFKGAHATEAQLDETQILAHLSPDDQEILNSIQDLDPMLVLLAPLGFILLLMGLVGRTFGQARGNGIEIHAEQFPEVHALWCDMASQLGLKETPALYLSNGNGSLNAFATCIPGFRPFGVVYSDLLEAALRNQDQQALRFVLGHELGHIRLGHVSWWYALLTVVGNLPGFSTWIGLPLSRAREYGCDKLGLELSGDTDCKGLLMLAAGKHLYRRVQLPAYHARHLRNRSRWDAASNLLADHPNLNWRIGALRCHCHGPLFWARAWPNDQLSSNAEPNLQRETTT